MLTMSGVRGATLCLQGEDAAILGTVGALTDCLQRPGGCAVVPGIPSDQYTLTLITSLVGGVVFGYSLRLEPSGEPKYQPCTSRSMMCSARLTNLSHAPVCMFSCLHGPKYVSECT